MTAVRLSCAELGLPPAVSDMRLRFMQVRERWIVYAIATREDAVALRDWVECLAPRTVHVSGRGVVRAELDEVPPRLLVLLGHGRFIDLRVNADSTVVLDAPVHYGKATSTVLPPRVIEAVLTDRQETALEIAVAAGYYDLPRRTTLQWLADSMGIGVSSLSELLRRAESRLARAHIVNRVAAKVQPLRPGGTDVAVAEAPRAAPAHFDLPVSNVLGAEDPTRKRRVVAGGARTKHDD